MQRYRCIAHKCGVETDGRNIVCERCRKTQSSHQRNKHDKVFHEIVIEHWRVDDMYECSYCKRHFVKEMICADHILTKGSHPELRYDLSNGRSSCFHCNQSDVKAKFLEKENFEKHHY